MANKKKLYVKDSRKINADIVLYRHLMRKNRSSYKDIKPRSQLLSRLLAEVRWRQVWYTATFWHSGEQQRTSYIIQCANTVNIHLNETQVRMCTQTASCMESYTC